LYDRTLLRERATLASITLDELVLAGLPLVVCVSSDQRVRERLAGQADGGGILLMCPDVEALRALLTANRPPKQAIAAELPPDLVIDVRDRHVAWKGSNLQLTRLECEIMAQLCGEPIRVWPYETLFAAVWGSAYLGDNSILHSAVKRLRRKLRAAGGGLSIDTVRGIGYRIAIS
jgi:hypothetical protein